MVGPWSFALKTAGDYVFILLILHFYDSLNNSESKEVGQSLKKWASKSRRIGGQPCCMHGILWGWKWNARRLLVRGIGVFDCGSISWFFGW